MGRVILVEAFGLHSAPFDSRFGEGGCRVPICFNGCGDVDSASRSQFEPSDLWVSQEGIDSRLDIGLRDHSGPKKLADGLRLWFALEQILIEDCRSIAAKKGFRIRLSSDGEGHSDHRSVDNCCSVVVCNYRCLSPQNDHSH